VLLEESVDFPPKEIAGYLDVFPTNKVADGKTFLAHIEQLTQADSKDSALKSLQGHLWKQGFNNRELVAPLYPDVAPAIKEWSRFRHRPVAIFSSGSEAAQRMFMSHAGRVNENEYVSNEIGAVPRGLSGAGSDVEDGSKGQWAEDLTGFLSGYFDTVNTGNKFDPESYTKIARVLDQPAEGILFFSDNVNGMLPSQSTTPS